MRVQADRFTAASSLAVTDAKAVAEAIVTEAGAWVETRIRAAGEAAAEALLGRLQRETDKAQRASRTAVRAAWVGAAANLVLAVWLVWSSFWKIW